MGGGGGRNPPVAGLLLFVSLLGEFLPGKGGGELRFGIGGGTLFPPAGRVGIGGGAVAPGRAGMGGGPFPGRVGIGGGPFPFPFGREGIGGGPPPGRDGRGGGGILAYCFLIQFVWDGCNY